MQSIGARFAGVAEAVSAKTTQAAMDIYEQVSRLRLEVDLNAPVVILPQHSQSRTALVFDLGSLSIFNELQADKGAVIDHVTLSISSIAFDRVEDYSADKGAGASFSIIKQPEPTVILLKRNLSFKTDTSRSEIEAEGKLPSLEFALSNLDYQTMLDTIAQNFSEGAEPRCHLVHHKHSVSPLKPLPSVREVQEPEEQPLTGEDKLDQLKEPVPQIEGPSSPLLTPLSTDLVERNQSTKILFLHLDQIPSTENISKDPPRNPRRLVVFDLDSIVASLYWINRPKSRNRSNAAPPESAGKPASFELTGLHADAAVTKDWIVDGKLTLKNLTLQDCRGSFDRRMNNLLSLRENEQDGNPKDGSLVEVTANVDGNGNQSFTVKVGHFEARTKDTSSNTDFQADKCKTPLKQLAKESISHSASPDSRRSSTPATFSRTIVVNVVVDNPTVLLIEDPKNLDSRVLLFTTNLKICMGLMDGSQSFQASAENLRMFATRYKTRSSNSQLVLDLPILRSSISTAGTRVNISE